jgi:hypothetical protein
MAPIFRGVTGQCARDDLVAQIAIYVVPPCSIVDTAVGFADANQSEAGNARESARCIDQIGDLPEPSSILLPLKAATSGQFTVCGRRQSCPVFRNHPAAVRCRKLDRGYLGGLRALARSCSNECRHTCHRAQQKIKHALASCRLTTVATSSASVFACLLSLHSIPPWRSLSPSSWWRLV